MQTQLVLRLGLCLASVCAATAHGDPASKPISKLKLAQRLQDCRDCTISASPSILASERSWVTVELKGVSYGQASDWVGAFSPDDFDAAGRMLKFPIRWQHASTSCGPRSDFSSSTESQQRHKIRCAGEACCTTNDYTRSGSATLRFQLVNLRKPYIFALVQGSEHFPEVVAITKRPVTFVKPAEPTQLHTALTSTPAFLRVSWTTANVSGAQYARWGSADASLDGAFAHTALASAVTYSADELCDTGGPAKGMGWRDPGLLWSATIGPLTAGAEYRYTVGSDSVGWSHQRADGAGDFVVRGPAAVGARTARMIAFGDMGKAPSAWDGSLEHSWDNDGRGEVGSWNTSKMLRVEAAGLRGERRRVRTDAILHIGDISYAVGYGAEWDEWMSQVEPVAARVPWMVQDGNHERNCPCVSPSERELQAGINWLNGDDSGGECGVPYDHRFSMPSDASTGRRRPWYLVTAGPIAAVLMSTERDFSYGSQQLVGLDSLLASVNRSAHPWLLFGGHRPMYVDSIWPSPSGAPLRELVEPLLLRHRVDLALWGHHHSYQRSCPMAHGECVRESPPEAHPSTMRPPNSSSASVGGGDSAAPWGVTHVVVGAAGYEFSEVAPATQKKSWVAFVNNTRYGFGAIDADMESLCFSFVRSDGEGVMDEFTLRK